MPYYPVPETCQLEMVYSQEESTNLVENVYHFQRSGGWSAAQMTDLLTYMSSWETTYGKAWRPGSVGLLKIRCRDLSVVNGLEVAADYFIAGTNVGEDLPSNVTWALKWTTGFAGRSYRGRTYHIGVCRTFLNTGDRNIMDATTAGSIVTAYSHILTGTIPDTGKLVVVSRKGGNAWRNPPITTPIIAVGYADLIVDNQRRRLPGHNRHR